MFAVGAYGNVLRFDGGEWKNVPAATQDFLSTVVGVGDDVYAAGSGGTVLTNGPGGGFLSQNFVDYCISYYGSWAVGPDREDDVLFACNFGGIIRVSIEDGLEVSERLHSNPEYTLNSIVATSVYDITAVGKGGIVLRYDGNQWEEAYPFGELKLWKIFLRKLFAGRFDLYIAGEEGFFALDRGEGWEVMDTGTGESLNGIWAGSYGTAHDPCAFIVGDHGTILLMDQDEEFPRAMQSGTQEHLWDAWGFSCHDVYAVGNGGTILKLTCRELE